MANNDRTNRRWKNRHLVRERDTQRARRLWATLALVVVALTPAGLYLYEQNCCLQLSYEIESIENQRKKLAEAERRLEVLHAGVASMKSIEHWAARQDLERPAPEEIVVVPYETTMGDPMMARVPAGHTESAPRRPRQFE